MDISTPLGDQLTRYLDISSREFELTAANMANFISSLGNLVSQASTLNTAQQTSLTQLQNQRDALSSVNLDDEAASLEDLERCYQAASKMFSILDSVLASALNLGVDTSVS